MTPAGTSAQRGLSISVPPAPISAAVASSVRCVPIAGIATSAVPNVPSRLPTVESAYSRPATAPAVAMSVTASRTAKGATAPSSVTGGTNSTSTAKNEPMAAPVETSSSPFTETSRNGRATNGITATPSAAASTIAPSRLGSGRRSATRPPSQYPSDSEASTSPMTFAQTIVELP